MAGEDFLGLASPSALAHWALGDGPLPAHYRQLPGGQLQSWHSLALPSLSAAQSLDLWPRLDGAFAQTPTLHGVPAETGAWARQQEHPLVRALAADPLRARWIARLLEWVQWCCGSPVAGRISSTSVAHGVGRSAVDTARGLLLHQVSLAADQVAELTIVAPTEWNFHPEGVLAGWLRAGADPALIPAAISSLDPCVASRLCCDP